MYKISKLNTVGSILARSKITNFKLVGYRLQPLKTSVNEVKNKSQFLFYVSSTILTGVLGTSGIVVYSKYDPKFREILTNNIPGSDKFLKVCLFEDKEILDQSKRLGGRIICKVAQQVKSTKESIGLTDNIVDKSIEQIKTISKSFPTTIPLISNKEEKITKEKQEPQQQNESIKTNIESVKPKEPQQQNESIKTNIESVKPKEKSQKLPSAPVITPVPQYTLEELETEILKKSSLCVNALKNATEAIKVYSESIYKLIESATDNIDPNLNVKLQQLEEKKNKIFINAYEDAKKYKKEIIENKKLLTETKFEETPDKLSRTIHKTNEVLEELNNANLALEKEEYKLNYIKKYKTNVNEAQANLIEEFECLFPGSDITQHKINIKNKDFDIFLLYALKKLNYYQDKLSKQEATLDRKINHAMNADFLNVETMNEMNSRLNSELHKLDEQFNNQLNEFNIKVDEDLQEQLKTHTQAHADLIAKAVDFTKEEFENRVRQELSNIEKLERQKYQSQLDSLKSDLQSVVNNLKDQAGKEKKLFANQAIWEAGELLKSSLTSTDNDQPIIIKKQINAIKKLGETDPMVNQVVNTVPSKALENGVFSKGQLKNDFEQVEKRIYQTALIPDDRFNLPLMVFSYLASLFVIQHSHISPNEVNNEVFDPLELNTYEIVERARYCIDRDDILQALRYLNLLTGCSRVVAKEWMKEATLFLETKQTIDLLMSHVTITSHSATHNA